jgi:hypothetical protein
MQSVFQKPRLSLCLQTSNFSVVIAALSVGPMVLADVETFSGRNYKGTMNQIQ